MLLSRQKLRRYRYKRKRCASNRRLQRVPFVSMRKLITPESWSAFEHFVAIRKQRGLERKERRKRWRRWRRSRSYRRWKRRKGKKRYPRWLRVKRKKIERPDGVFRWRLKWLGRLFPTYYVIAVEDEFPAPRAGRNRRLHPVPVYDKDGKVLAVVSRVFRRQLYIQGTGILRDGRVLNYHSRHRRHIRFVVLPAGSYGLGIKEYALMPYRSVAIDFRELARRVRFPLSRAKQLVGQLLYIPRLRRALLPNGRRHDGYICAVDIGSAIRRDRIDIFVGLEGGGNPYALPCRHHNAFSRHGVESLNPMDWPTRRKRRRGYGLADRYEYRKTAKHKALKIFVVPGAKCRQKPYTNLTKLDTRTAD